MLLFRCCSAIAQLWFCLATLYVWQIQNEAMTRPPINLMAVFESYSDDNKSIVIYKLYTDFFNLYQSFMSMELSHEKTQ